MSHAVAVVTDSTADLSPERARELNIHIIPLVVRIDGASYDDGSELPSRNFYAKLATAGSIPTTSQPSSGRFKELYEAIDAPDIISIHISSKLSGTCNAARVAAEQVPGKRIQVLDSQALSLGMSYLAQIAAGEARRGAPLEGVCDVVQRQLTHMGFYALLETLQHAHRSGRIGFAQAMLGGVLQIKPILTLRGGAVEPVDRPRTMRKGLDRLFELTAKEAPFAYIGVAHANNDALAGELAERLTPIAPGKVDVVTTGAVLGTHCGPGAVATCFVRS
ncbi:MAG TPA: DegV family protein [Chloroflexota bacterium]|nr:DegV family protein [Chloroflexota bacterium]